MQAADFFEACSREGTLWGGALIDSNADKDLAKQSEYTRNIVQTGDDRSLAVRLRLYAGESDAKGSWLVEASSYVKHDLLFVVHFLREMKGAILVSQTNWSAKKYTHTLVGTEEQPESASSDLTLNRI
jgi:hypothetical protein